MIELYVRLSEQTHIKNKMSLTHVKAVIHSQAPVPIVTYGILSVGIPDWWNK